jgi:hypothetical protein
MMARRRKNLFGFGKKTTKHYTRAAGGGFKDVAEHGSVKEARLASAQEKREREAEARKRAAEKRKADVLAKRLLAKQKREEAAEERRASAYHRKYEREKKAGYGEYYGITREELMAKKKREREEAKADRQAVQGSYRGYKLGKTPDGQWFSSLDRDSWFDTKAQAKKFIDQFKQDRGNPSKFDRCVKAVQAKGGDVNAYAVCTAATKRKKNSAAAAAEAFKEFHGHPSTEVVTVSKKIHRHEHLAAAGELRGMSVKPVSKVLPVRHIGGLKGAILAFNEAKNQLFIEGGNQYMSDAELKKFGISKPHELETLGKVVALDYFTSKSHLGDEGGTAVYAHKLRTTNENGRHVVVRIARYPDLIYRVLDQQMEFSGGSYEIRAEGIDK